MFRQLFNKLYEIIALIIQGVINFFSELRRVRNTRYRELTWPKRILKAVLFAIKGAIIIGIGFLLVSGAIMFVVFLTAANAIGSGLENGMNEAMGRNRYRRYYY